ncbi:MAG: biotin transport system substrate-specific component [Candidatus Methanomethylophilaceae archaeon]|nr:MAG: Putative biotin transporter bioY [Methanomicrobiales archaeon 53_19]MDI3483228.1 biotin transport system substrate-specific component [Candidatus Methanomethylophilaceae archaeon]MDI3542368.1 biotin transport system substrate-specific component [Candidatus Methanomethylophilaceae archaeon]
MEIENRAQLMAYSATFIALIAAGSWISIPFVPVPLTLQTLFVMLAGIVMKRYSVIPVASYVALGTLNLPVFHNGTAGIGILLGPTGGFIIGFLPAVLIIGLAYESCGKPRRVAGLILGNMVIYAFGVVWLSVSASMPLLEAAIIGVLPFIVGDAVKTFAAYQVGKRLE